MPSETRQRILSSAMRLFGEQGFSATSIAQIEHAAGLSSGSGALYRHFPSKDALLAAGVRERIEDRGSLLGTMAAVRAEAAAAPATAPSTPASARHVLAAIASAGMARLDDERDLNRVLVRDLADRPELLAFFRDEELRVDHAALRDVLAGLLPAHDDPEALAAILIDAVSHYWLMSDLYGGEHPTGIPRDRYIAALVGLVADATEGAAMNLGNNSTNEGTP